MSVLHPRAVRGDPRRCYTPRGQEGDAIGQVVVFGGKDSQNDEPSTGITSWEKGVRSMYDLFRGLSVLSFLAMFYFLVGLLVPRLPLVRTRKRAGMFVAASIALIIVFGSIADATLTPEQRQQLAADRQGPA